MTSKSLERLLSLCKSFVGEKIHMRASFRNATVPVTNPNLVGDLLEDIFFPFYKEVCPEFERGPKQEPPDFIGEEFQFEQKAFNGKASFDISNFTSLVHQMSKPGGLEKKVFKTKYLVYEYDLEDDAFIIKNFWLLNIWQLPAYDKKYPICMQMKKGIWYNIRPGSPSGWYDTAKTPQKFLDKLIQCIDNCTHLEDKDKLKNAILLQMHYAKNQGYF